MVPENPMLLAVPLIRAYSWSIETPGNEETTIAAIVAALGIAADDTDTDLSVFLDTGEGLPPSLVFPLLQGLAALAYRCAGMLLMFGGEGESEPVQVLEVLRAMAEYGDGEEDDE